MNRLLAVSVAAFVLPFTSPGQDAREALTEFRERRLAVGMQAGCSLRGYVALSEGDLGRYEAIVAECARLN